MTEPKRSKRVTPDPELVKLADALLANYQKPEDLIGEHGLLKQLTKMLVERALETEMTEHLGHDKSGAVTNGTSNTRNGHSAKTLQGDFGGLPLDIPATAREHSSRNWLPSTRPVGPVLTTRSSRCTPVA